MYHFNLDEYLADLEFLVNIDSGSRIPGGTTRVAAFFEEKYIALGLTVKKLSFSEDLGPCLEIRNKPDTKPEVLFLGHMDTVFPKGEAEKRPFTRIGDHAFGPGVADMKGGLLSTFYLVRQLIAENADLSFCIALNSDEEISSITSQDWIKSLARTASFALVMEPGRKNGEYVVERKGLARYIVQVEGVAAHAGVAPQNGASAIHELAKLITAAAALNNYAIGTSINVGVISGGTVANVVCDHAECQIDTRFEEIEEHIKFEEQIKELAATPSDPRVSISYKRAGFRPPMRKTAATEQIMKVMKDLGEKLGITVQWVKTGGGSDGNFVAFEGCLVIDGAGPTGDKVHSPEEVLRVDSIEPRIRLLHDTILHLTKKERE